jgi:hypothetical protein
LTLAAVSSENKQLSLTLEAVQEIVAGLEAENGELKTENAKLKSVQEIINCDIEGIFR